jgi:hypothetical protein
MSPRRSMISFPHTEWIVDMANRNSVDIVENFWRAVWQSRNPDAVDRFIADDFVITSAGGDISRADFKKWVATFQSQITDLEFHIVESFQNETGDRVASRWRITGKNNGFMNTEPSQAPIDMSGIAIWHVREDGLLQHNWVERNAHEVYRRLVNK